MKHSLLPQKSILSYVDRVTNYSFSTQKVGVEASKGIAPGTETCISGVSIGSEAPGSWKDFTSKRSKGISVGLSSVSFNYYDSGIETGRKRNDDQCHHELHRVVSLG